MNINKKYKAYCFTIKLTPNRLLSNNPTATTVFEKIKYFAETVTIDFLLYLLSIENLITASWTFNVRIGIKIPIVVLKRS